MTTVENYLLSLYIILFITASSMILWKQSDENSALSVTMIDVNSGYMQGDAHLIQSPTGKTVMIDTGAPVYGKSALVPSIKKKGIKKIDAIFISHPHIDHYGGLVDLIKSGIKISSIYMNTISNSWFEKEPWGGKIEDIRLIQETAKTYGIPIKNHSEWNEYELNGSFKLKKIMCLESINPGDNPDVSDINDMSLVASLMRNNSHLALFTADINTKSANRLQHDRLIDFSYEVLKLPHHCAESWGGEHLFKKASPAILLCPTPVSIWQTTRCERAKNMRRELNSQLFSNAMHGEVIIDFSFNKTIRVKTEQNPH